MKDLINLFKFLKDNSIDDISSDEYVDLFYKGLSNVSTNDLKEIIWSLVIAIDTNGGFQDVYDDLVDQSIIDDEDED